MLMKTPRRILLSFRSNAQAFWINWTVNMRTERLFANQQPACSLAFTPRFFFSVFIGLSYDENIHTIIIIHEKENNIKISRTSFFLCNDSLPIISLLQLLLKEKIRSESKAAPPPALALLQHAISQLLALCCDTPAPSPVFFFSTAGPTLLEFSLYSYQQQTWPRLIRNLI